MTQAFVQAGQPTCRRGSGWVQVGLDRKEGVKLCWPSECWLCGKFWRW